MLWKAEKKVLQRYGSESLREVKLKLHSPIFKKEFFSGGLSAYSFGGELCPGDGDDLAHPALEPAAPPVGGQLARPCNINVHPVSIITTGHTFINLFPGKTEFLKYNTSVIFFQIEGTWPRATKTQLKKQLGAAPQKNIR